MPPQAGFRRIGLVLASCSCLAAILGVVIAQYDQSISASLRAWDLPGDIEKAINLSEAYAHTSGVVMILLALFLTVDVRRRSALWMAVLITTVAGVSANLMKTGFVRVRPHSVNKIVVVETPADQDDSDSGARELAIDGVEQVDADIWDARQRSFPSGHTATAWGLSIGLSLAFPRSTIVFVLLASLASLQRVTCGAHFPSDVAAGASIAFAASLIVVIVAERYSKGLPAGSSAGSQSGGADEFRGRASPDE